MLIANNELSPRERENVGLLLTHNPEFNEDWRHALVDVQKIVGMLTDESSPRKRRNRRRMSADERGLVEVKKIQRRKAAVAKAWEVGI